MEAKALVVKALKESAAPLKSAEIAQKAGLDKAEVYKVIKVLKKEEVVTSPKACYYTIKK